MSERITSLVLGKNLRADNELAELIWEFTEVLGETCWNMELREIVNPTALSFLQNSKSSKGKILRKSKANTHTSAPTEQIPNPTPSILRS